MKTKLLIPLLVLPLLSVGCTEKPTGCVEYAPEDANISWTDYNSVSDVMNYFHCHKKTSALHNGDTLKIKGLVCKGYPEHWTPGYIIGADYSVLTLTDNPSQQETSHLHMINITLPEEISEQFRQNLDEYMELEWYVTGILHSAHDWLSPLSDCCSYYTSMHATEVKLKQIAK